MNGSAVSNSMPFSTVCEVNTELLIPASPEEVWDVFGDFANWGTWNDFMVLPIAPSKVGQHCKVEFCLEGGCIRRSIHSPEVLVLAKNKELRWRDHRALLHPFFRGSHWWVLEPLPDGRTRFVHGAKMMGLALPFLQATMRATLRGYKQFNCALRDEVLAQQKAKAGHGKA